MIGGNSLPGGMIAFQDLYKETDGKYIYGSAKRSHQDIEPP